MRACWLGFAFALLLAPVTHAQSPDLEAEARARFELGGVHMQNGRFIEAAQEFAQAYELSGKYELLYNVHLAYRDAGEPGPAADALAAFLEEAPAELENRTSLEARLASLRRQAEPGSAESDHASAPPVEEPTPAVGSGPGPLPFVLMGVGAAAIVGGTVTGIVALGISDDLAGLCTGGRCPAEREGDASTGQALAITTDVLLGVGVVAAAVGVVLLLTSGGDDEEVTASAACTTRGCLGTLRGRF